MDEECVQKGWIREAVDKETVEWVMVALMGCGIVFTIAVLFGNRPNRKGDDDGEIDLKVEDWYPGRWYEIATIQSPFLKIVRWTTNNSIDFTLLGDGTMDLAASCYNRSFLFGEKSRRFNSGTAHFSGKNTVTWTMSLFSGLITFSFRVKIKYVSPNRDWIILAPDRHHSSSVYICCRQPFMKESDLKDALHVVKTLGFNLDKLSPTSQKDPYDDVYMLPTVRRYGVLSVSNKTPFHYNHFVKEDSRLMLSPFIFRGNFCEKYCEDVRRKFFEGCVRGDLAFMYDFIQREPLWVDARDANSQWMCLHYAAYNGHAHIVEYVLEQGAGVNARTADMDSPLILAIHGFLRHIKERITWREDNSLSIFNLMGGDERYSHKPHSLYNFEQTVEAILQWGGAVRNLKGSANLPLEVLQRGIEENETLRLWMKDGESSESENLVRSEIIASVKQIQSHLFYAETINMAPPIVENIWMRSLFLGFVLLYHIARVSVMGAIRSIRAILLGLKFVFLLILFWYGLRPVGYVYYCLLCRAFSKESLDNLLDTYQEFRGKCILYMILTMNNPTIHKIAQILSSRPDLVDRHIATQLEVLRENVPPMSHADLETELACAFGKDRSHIFEWFEMKAMASGTIAQVHRAKFANGGPVVAVKVVRRSIRGGLERVLRLVNLILSIRGVGNKAIIERAKRVYALFMCQTDMMLEAASINAIQYACDRAQCDKYRIPRIPRVYSLATSRNILTMELMEDQVPVTRYEETGIPREVILMRLSHFHLRSCFIDGIFHCDLHPGNILLDPKDNGRATLLDFGLVGEMEEDDRMRMTAFFLAAVSGEFSVALSLFRKYFILNAEEAFKNQESIDAFDRDMEPVLRRYWFETENWDVSSSVQDLDRVYRKHGLQGTASSASVELSGVAFQATKSALNEASQEDSRELYRQFVTSNYAVLLRSISTCEYYEQIRDKILERFNWGAILYSAVSPETNSASHIPPASPLSGFGTDRKLTD